MAFYVIRLTIHEGSRGDYDQVHSAMAEFGCSRTIVSDDGRPFKLQDATYLIATDIGIEMLRNLIVRVVHGKVPKQELPDVAVFRVDQAAWHLHQQPRFLLGLPGLRSLQQ